jgi:ATP-dependent helicase/nuclease subunit B
MQRHFLGLEQPALAAAVDWLLAKYGQGQSLDLSNVVAVLPGGRAGRRLVEVLVELADAKKLSLSPPRVCTPSVLPELFYQPKLAFANPLTQRLAWLAVLRQCDPDDLRDFAADDDTVAWLKLADTLRGQHIELAADGLDFSHVLQTLEEQGVASEARRWRRLSQVQQAYLRTLDDLSLWDRQTARLMAIKQREIATERDIVLIGAVDLNQALRQMLDQISDRACALIYAPDGWRSRFDEYGCLLPDAWAEKPIELSDSGFRVVDGPIEQAEAVARCLADLDGSRGADEITIGVPDELLVPQLERTLGLYDVPVRWGPGDSIAQTTPARLLAAVRGYLLNPRFDRFAALVRHCDLFSWMQRNWSNEETPDSSGLWLTELDVYQREHLPARLTGYWLRGEHEPNRLKVVFDWVQKLMKPLAGKKRPLCDWRESLLEFLSEIYGVREINRNNPADRGVEVACRAIASELTESQPDVPQELAFDCDAATAIDFVLQAIAGEPVPAPVEGSPIEILGWLELLLDDAPVLIVTSVNEGFLPSSLNSDLFLPNRLRQRLGIEDNARRYARDAYVLSAVSASTRELQLIVARRNTEGDPLSPSRLLFATDEETIARRSLAFFAEPADKGPRRLQVPGGVSLLDTANFPYQKPRPLARPIESLSPTAFRSYLACPYRFYLSNVLRLECVNDDARELDGARFGSLLHEVLQRFGESEHKDRATAEDLRDVLSDLLDKTADEMFGIRGNHPLPSVRVQIEQARLRLNAFAEHQVAWYEQGWRIRHVETIVRRDEPAEFVVDGKPFGLHGRIDRIDENERTGEWAILDYKSSDAPTTPEKSHQTREEWKDLQLPLYRHLAQKLGIAGDALVGYILLPRDAAGGGFSIAEWSPADFDSADEAARQVVRAVREEIFWPPADPPPDFSEELAWMCQDGVFGRPPFDAPGAGTGVAS